MSEFMEHELERLSYHGVLISAVGIPLTQLRVTHHHPKDFFAYFNFTKQRTAAVRRGYIVVDGVRYTIAMWSADMHVHHPTWGYRVRLYLEGVLQYAWNKDALDQILGDICLFDRIEEEMVQCQNTAIFVCWMWMWNLDLLPQMKLSTFFPLGAGRVTSGVTPPMPDEIAPPPEGRMVNVLIHLD
ncbi:hypothetical protein E2562_020710 [Oryza meyeriana var. granulata]|uniref:DUF4283 domain-containing protein n=1 Tax=Oryza meyeriana var. granulata TaxID=110450 RepID=A0A6G1EN22_9ORYZ|nr:hypothetical protein E2562_020710 [Oryza meyeriana var. granulata]